MTQYKVEWELESGLTGHVFFGTLEDAEKSLESWMADDSSIGVVKYKIFEVITTLVKEG